MKLPSISKNARIVLLGAFIFASFGLFMFPWMIWSRARVKEMATWPKAEAKVSSTGIKSVYHKNEGIKYQQDISYIYRIDGISYVNDKVSYGDRPPEWNSESQARSALPALESSITISYNPAKPDDSVIHVFVIPESDANYLLLVSGFAGLAGGGLMLAGFIEMKKQK